jgi:hypothetical protein
VLSGLLKARRSHEREPRPTVGESRWVNRALGVLAWSSACCSSSRLLDGPQLVQERAGRQHQPEALLPPDARRYRDGDQERRRLLSFGEAFANSVVIVSSRR